MAALDFPASPTDGQTFSAPNGVVYVWSSSKGLWLVQSTLAPGAVGDFSAINNQTLAGIPASWVPVSGAALTVINGNSGGYLNLSTGRWTPPAGRYVMMATAAFTNPSSIVNAQLGFMKNGANPVSSGLGGTPAVNQWENVSWSQEVDANGTDYFQVALFSSTANASAINLTWNAFPISGVQGPPGPPGSAAVGDFFARRGAALTIGTNTVIVMDTVITGNSGAWYNTSDGRYTPPAGRYKIWGSVAGSASAGSAAIQSWIQKNGGNLVTSSAQTVGANAFASTFVEGEFDANGTDYFTLAATGTNSAAILTPQGCFFGAHPITGLTGPQGPAGVLATDTGIIVDFAGSTAPTGWLLCNGQLVSRTTYAALFAVIGTVYGAGDGSTTFAVPDLGGRVTAGKETTATRLTAAGSGIVGSTLGATGGAETHALAAAQNAGHTHDLGGHYHTSLHGAGYPFLIANGGDAYWSQTYSLGGGAVIYYTYGTSGPSVASGSSGSGTPHQNTQPTIIMNKIIKV